MKEQEKIIDRLWKNWKTSFNPARMWQRNINGLWYKHKGELIVDINNQIFNKNN